MHELAITQSVVEAVTERTGSAPVVSVRVRVGRLAGVVPDAIIPFDFMPAMFRARSPPAHLSFMIQTPSH